MCKVELHDGTIMDWQPDGYIKLRGTDVYICDNEEESIGIYKIITPTHLKPVCYDNVPLLYPEFKRCFKEEKKENGQKD